MEAFLRHILTHSLFYKEPIYKELGSDFFFDFAAKEF